MRKIYLSHSDITDFLLILLLLFSPLALGSVHTWAYCTIAIISLIIFNLHFLNDINGFKRTTRLPISIGLLLFILAVFFYIAPLPARAIRILSPAAFNLRKEFMLQPAPWQTLSLYPRATIIYLVKTVSYIMIFLVTISKIIHPGRHCEDPENKLPPPIFHTFIVLGALISVFAILVHSICDFNLHIPANALYFMVILAIAAGLSLTRERHLFDYHFVGKLVNSIIMIGFVIAVFAIIQKFSWNGKIYWLINKSYGGNFGPYINYDHYAGYMEMCAFLAIAYFMGHMASSPFFHIKKIKEKIVWFSSPEANKTLIYLFFSVVMVSSLFLSTSRAGIISFCIAMIVFSYFIVITIRKKRRTRLFFSALVIILLIVIMLIWFGPEPIIERFKALHKVIRTFIKEPAVLSELRPYIWKDTLNLIKNFPVFGTGMGTYSYVFPKYRTFAATYGFLRYAHNDYLQFISEMGVVSIVFIAGFFVWYVRKVKKCLERFKNSM